jgi:hypothetical protein
MGLLYLARTLPTRGPCAHTKRSRPPLCHRVRGFLRPACPTTPRREVKGPGATRTGTFDPFFKCHHPLPFPNLAVRILSVSVEEGGAKSGRTSGWGERLPAGGADTVL